MTTLWWLCTVSWLHCFRSQCCTTTVGELPPPFPPTNSVRILYDRPAKLYPEVKVKTVVCGPAEEPHSHSLVLDFIPSTQMCPSFHDDSADTETVNEFDTANT